MAVVVGTLAVVASSYLMEDYKLRMREKVWSELREVAYPDSRFHYDFAEFIADFRDSEKAISRLVEEQCYQNARVIFITPDNCLEQLRRQALRDHKIILITTYGIRRGFLLLDPARIEASEYRYAGTLDGMELVGRPMELYDMVTEGLTIDLMVTGTGAINDKGIRFGKGHGFFDLEWGMLYTVGVISVRTPTIAVVHDCQVLKEDLVPEEFDTVCELVVTPTRVVRVTETVKPACGIIWDKLAEGMLENIPPLQALKNLIETGKVNQPMARRSVRNRQNQ